MKTSKNTNDLPAMRYSQRTRKKTFKLRDSDSDGNHIYVAEPVVAAVSKSNG